MTTDYSTFKVTELRELLKERGIPQTGLTRKQQMIDALVQSDAKEDGPTSDAKQTEDKDKQEVVEDADDEKEPVNGDSVEANTAETRDAPEENVTDGVAAKAQDTPKATSEAPEVVSDTKKRKRRSPTPPLSDDAVSKKLKAAQEATVPAADAPVADAPIEDTNSPPSLHPPTRAIFIRELIRPIQPGLLREYLTKAAAPPGAQPNDKLVESFHLDLLRTHAFVIFTTVHAASRARARLHDTVWPDEPSRKPLWVDFAPESLVSEWIETELSDGTSRRDAKRYTVVYDTNNGSVTATLKEVQSGSAQAKRQPSNFEDHRPETTRRPSDFETDRADTRGMQRPASSRRDSDSFDILDQRFHFTTAKPKLYFQPQPPDIVEHRIQQLRHTVSRDWPQRRYDLSNYADGELRRYTFDDGYKFVDGGPDRGAFGNLFWGRRGRGGAPPFRGQRGRRRF
ncbi:hypothetical protein K470DRAFT_243379 [Piedraia hortae CBS 480.64]|uniref:SAP domain-containing protein n=1 Tax=Piedraia hortae CBS 480.64 TaxID=1314780 RepID=A0A6A7C5K5_9PEZI|nr:hypothetical protein K470DRAFT_243379 [Piedraia hortae CBS 480.64]